MFLPTTTRNFDKLSEEVANKFFSENEPLEDIIVKVAGREKLNPEEVRRLTEMSNTCATVKLLKSSRDKTAEVVLADYDNVIKSTHPTDTVIVKEAKYLNSTMKFPEERLSSKNISLRSLEKTAQSNTIIDKTKKVFTFRKQLEELTRQKTASEIRIMNGFDYLIAEFSKMGAPDFNKFASEVYSIYGSVAQAALDNLAKALDEKIVLEKVAYIIDDRTNVMAKFASVYDDIRKLLDIRKGITEVKAKLNTEWDAFKAKKEQ
jgi:hypothetical protein